MEQKAQNPHIFPMNPAQKAAAEAKNGPLLIVAGAGTGKTRTLTSRIIYLIQVGIPAGRICAITFTNKAAREMLNRVNAMRVDKKTGPEPLISTFHSLGARILRKECRHLGRTPNFAIFDDHDSFDLIKKVVKAVLPKPPKGQKLAKLNKKETPAFFAGKISEIKNVDGALSELNADKEKNKLVLEEGKGRRCAGRRPWSGGKYPRFHRRGRLHVPEDIPKLVEPIFKGEADHVTASRMTGGSSELHGGFDEFLRLTGSSFITACINRRYHVRLSDSQNGFRAIRSEVFLNLGLKLQ